MSAVRSSFTRTQVPAVHFPAGSRQETAREEREEQTRTSSGLSRSEQTGTRSGFSRSATAGAAKTSSWTGHLKARRSPELVQGLAYLISKLIPNPYIFSYLTDY